MTLTLDLPRELEGELAEEAAGLGLALPDYVLRLLAAGRASGSPPRTGPELVAYWSREGLIGTRPEPVDSPELARRLREQAQGRRG